MTPKQHLLAKAIFIVATMLSLARPLGATVSL